MKVSDPPSSSELRCPISITDNDARLLHTLLYFEIFRFPLTIDELWKYCSYKERDALEYALEQWVDTGIVLHAGDHYMLNNVGNKVEERIKGEKRARAMWSKACSRARLIQLFPFVRAVFISGSISKGVVAPDGDVDFFIITAPGRLWLSRTLLAMYKKIFLLGSHKYFCINYFIDDKHLNIEEQNYFTATEMATLIPMTGDSELVKKFYAANQWVKKYYPHFSASVPMYPELRKRRRRRVLETVLNISAASIWDKLGKRITTSFWRVKFRSMADKDFDLALKSEDHISKHHPLQFQKKVLESLAQNIAQFEEATGVKLGL